ncbi:MAG: hypothetical protein KDB79_14495 [Acidobacteria bacterium]|nr:hypothetical protein [Acidobacteriota bacterium]
MIRLRWRYGIIAGIFLAIFACYPQFKMWYAQGDQWHGHYAYNDIDEVAYAAYLQAVIDGRPRKNDPYTGRDDSASSPQPESLFSIQFAAPYTVGIPARILGISAPTAMTLAGALAGFLAAFACFWLIGSLTNDSVFAMAGSLVVLCGGALAAGEGAIGEILGIGVSYPYFPFLRRYVPAVPFPVFFVLLAAVWYLIASESAKRRLIWGAISFLSFSYLVFSYFYIWTTAAAWLAVIAALWLILRPNNWIREMKAFVLLGIACVIPLAAYGYMLSNRSQTMDDVQLLVYTHQPDLTRFPEYISLFVLAIVLIAVITRVTRLRDSKTIFALSFALVPIVVFNQQVITGRSLQPIHYQVFIGNYVAALSLVTGIGLFWVKLESKRLAANAIAIAIACLAVGWGFVECYYTVRALDRANVIRDNGIPLAKKLREAAGTGSGRFQKTILSISTIQSDDSPTIAPQNVLWSRHQHVFAGLTWQESKERYYQYLYYQNLDEKWLENRLQNHDYVSMISLFGWARHSSRLSSKAKPLTLTEIREEAIRYREYRNSFDPADAANPELSYLILPADREIDFENIDKWYERGEAELIGIYRLYKLKLKTGPAAK